MPRPDANRGMVAEPMRSPDRSTSTPSRPGRAALAVVVTLAGAVLPGGCGTEPIDPNAARAALRDTVDYVGASRCVGCHRAETEQWRGSHHDLAMQEVAADTVLGDFDDVEFEHFGIRSRFHRDGERYLVTTPNAAGEPETFQIAWVFGVTPLQQYLIDLGDGHLHALSICWDSRPAADGGQRWFHLFPDEPIAHTDPLHWTGRFFNWNRSCAVCHSTGLRRNYDAEHDRYATTWTDLDVACETCHGPGSAHVAWAEAGADPADSVRGLIVDLGMPGRTLVRKEGSPTSAPTSATAAQTQVETCAPCHSRRTQLDEHPWAGRPFADGHRIALLDRDLYEPDGQILDEVYVYGSFLQSKMHAAGVACSDCHDPHSQRLRAGGNALCAQCHDPQVFDLPAHHFHEVGSPGAQCVACHMPARTYMVVDPRRDHSFRVPRPDLALKLGTPDACTGCHTDWTPGQAAAAIDQHTGSTDWRRPHYGTALAAGRRSEPDAGGALRKLAEDVARPGIVRGSALSLLGERPEPASEAAFRKALADADPSLRVAALAGLDAFPLERRLALAAELLEDPVHGVRIEAARVLADVPLERFGARRAAFEAAFAEFVAAQRVDDDRASARTVLALALSRRGDLRGAEAEYRAAIRLEPYAVQPWVNLADLLRTQERDDAAEALLREGLGQVAVPADLEHVLGLVLVRKGERDEALLHLARAARLAPEQPRYAYVHAVALHDTGEPELAIRTLEEAVRRHPHDADLLQALVSFEMERGAADRALGWAERLVEARPDDPNARGLLQQVQAMSRGGR